MIQRFLDLTFESKLIREDSRIESEPKESRDETSEFGVDVLVSRIANDDVLLSVKVTPDSNIADGNLEDTRDGALLFAVYSLLRLNPESTILPDPGFG